MARKKTVKPKKVSKDKKIKKVKPKVSSIKAQKVVDCWTCKKDPLMTTGYTTTYSPLDIISQLLNKQKTTLSEAVATPQASLLVKPSLGLPSKVSIQTQTVKPREPLEKPLLPTAVAKEYKPSGAALPADYYSSSEQPLALIAPEPPVIKKRGRPKGSKNKPKELITAAATPVNPLETVPSDDEELYFIFPKRK